MKPRSRKDQSRSRLSRGGILIFFLIIVVMLNALVLFLASQEGSPQAEKVKVLLRQSHIPEKIRTSIISRSDELKIPSQTTEKLFETQPNVSEPSRLEKYQVLTFNSKKRSSTGSSLEIKTKTHELQTKQTNDASNKKESASQVVTVPTLVRAEEEVLHPQPTVNRDEKSILTVTGQSPAHKAVSEIEPSDKLNSLPKHLRGKPITTIYSSARKDRSGAAILYYFMGHAYAMKYGLTYGGICGNTTTLNQQMDLIDFLGLSKELPLACPRETNPPTHYMLPYFLSIDKSFQAERGIQLLTPEWIGYMRARGSSVLRQESSPQGGGAQKIQVAVHLRRGDVHTCHTWRFLPNQHYLDILDRYLPSVVAPNVTIYTELQKPGGLKPFLERGYTINVDGELVDIWRAMIQADVLVLSRSDFSLLPAVFNSRKILFTPWSEDKGPLSHWTTIDESISNKTFEWLRNACKSHRNEAKPVLSQPGKAPTHHHHKGNNRDSRSLTSLTWNETEACYNWKGVAGERPLSTNLPKGLITTLILGPPKLLELACQMLPNQLHYFAQPQGLDWLILIDDPLRVQNLTSCLDLERLKEPTRSWKNDDGSTIETRSYRFKGNTRTTIFIAKTRIMENLDLDPNWDQTKLPMVCNRYPMSYIQGTRWYSNELLHLAILREYDYFLKMDLDIHFVKPWNHFSIMSDMRHKRAIFGHAAHYVNGGKSCTRGIQQAVKKYRDEINQTHFCSDLPFVHRDGDYYYTNFIVGEVDFWTQPKVKHFGRYLTDLPHGFTTQRWTDQVFFHNAMALFVGPNFEAAVADYTDIRCMPDTTCWESISTYVMSGMNEWSPPCEGYMVHAKLVDSSTFSVGMPVEAARVLSEPYMSSYRYHDARSNCRA